MATSVLKAKSFPGCSCRGRTMGQAGNRGQACGPFGRAGTRLADKGLVSKVRLSRIPAVRNVWKVLTLALLLFGMAGGEAASRSPAPLTTEKKQGEGQDLPDVPHGRYSAES